MRIGYISGMLCLLSGIHMHAQNQEPDSIKNVSLSDVVVTETVQQIKNKNSTLHIDVAGEPFLRENFTGNLVQALNNIPGVHSMDIGSGFSKPMIRGMGFNRIAVVENGIKQEGQQWGADHGLEIDAFDIEQVNIKKGPLSLQYGSDAMGGAIEILKKKLLTENQVFGDASFLYKSVNDTYGGSLMLGIKKNKWMTKVRYSEQHFGDYRVPTDSIVYLTQRLPIHGKRMKNTAGYERDANWYTLYKGRRYEGDFYVSNAYQKVGFFPGAHGAPDASRLEDDGDHRNIDLPYSRVNHLKLTSGHKYSWDTFSLTWNVGYQNNHREEMSLFHTHYGNQAAPEKDSDKELAFTLHTISSSLFTKIYNSENWIHTVGWDIQYQKNTISGYSFLLPRYNRFTTGAYWISSYQLNDNISFNGGARYDHGHIKASAYEDTYLETYLAEQGYSQEDIDTYKWRSHSVDRGMGDFSASLGVVYTKGRHILQLNAGHSYRLPAANELASNGVHHGTFRHEQGDASLSSEKGWQFDAGYTFDNGILSVRATPFFSWFSNYIYLKPTGEWSILPHSGQIYRYTGAEAIFAGGELALGVNIYKGLRLDINGEYVYTYNLNEKRPLSFSPPASLRNILTYQSKLYQVSAEWQLIASQSRVSQNEEQTAGAGLFHLGASVNVPLLGTITEITFSAKNIFDKKYYNHLSFYRKVEIPEPGRNFQILIKIPFKSLLK